MLFRSEVSRSVGVAGNFASFRWEGLRVETASFDATSEGIIQSLRAEKLQAEVGLGAVTRGIWQVRAANVDKVEITLDAREDARATEASTPPPVAESTSEAKKNGWLPSEVALEGLTIQAVDLHGLLKSGAVAATGMKLKVEPDGAKDSYRATIDGGLVTTPWKLIPRSTLDRIKLRYQDKEVFVTDASMSVGTAGILEGNGEWSGKTGSYSFEGALSDMACADLLNETWAKRLTGKVASSFVVEGLKSGAKVRGRLKITDGSLTALPFLDTLSAYADTTRFRVLTLTDARADWTWEKNQTTLSHLVLASDGLVKLEGSLTIRGENLDGDFRLGLAPGTLAGIPGAETDVFLPGENGLLWAPLRITGTLDDPKEDLSDRLRAAAGQRMFEIIPQTGEKVLKFTQGVIGDNPDKVVQKGLDTLEKGTDVLNKAGDVVGEVSGVLGGLLGAEPRSDPNANPPPAPEPKK